MITIFVLFFLPLFQSIVINLCKNEFNLNSRNIKLFNCSLNIQTIQRACVIVLLVVCVAMNFVTLMSHMLLYLWCQVIWSLMVASDLDTLQYPSFYCPIDGINNILCYTLRSEMSDGEEAASTCKLDYSNSVAAIYLQQSHINSVSLFLQTLHDDIDNTTHYVWLGGKSSRVHAIERVFGLIEWQGWIDSLGNISLTAEIPEEYAESTETLCVAQKTSPSNNSSSNSTGLVWIPCSYKFNVLCSKDINEVSHETIFSSIKAYRHKINCSLYEPEELIDKINNFKETVNRSRLTSYLLPFFNLLVIIAAAAIVCHSQYEVNRSRKQSKDGDKSSKIVKNKVEARVSTYEDLRSEYEHYYHTI